MNVIRSNGPRFPHLRCFVIVAAAALAACDPVLDPHPTPDASSSLLGEGADPARAEEAVLPISVSPMAAQAANVELTQIGFVDKPRELAGQAGATSTSFFEGSDGALFATVYNTAGSTVAGAMSTMKVKKGKLKVDKDILTDVMGFAEARLIELDGDPFLLAAGTGAMDGSMPITSEAVFVASDLRRVMNLFDLPSGWGMGFDWSPHDPSKVVVATAPVGSLSYLDPTDGSGEVTTVVDGQPAFLGLSVEGPNTYVTDVTGSVRAFDAAGLSAGSWPLGGGLNPLERAEVSVCSSGMVVGAHTNGVLLTGGETQVAAEEFGIGASMLEDCSAFAATMEGGVVVGLEGADGYDLYRLTELDGDPLPYSNSVEILRIPEGSEALGGRWTTDGSGMLLIVVSSAEGTHFIEIRTEGE